MDWLDHPMQEKTGQWIGWITPCRKRQVNGLAGSPHAGKDGSMDWLDHPLQEKTGLDKQEEQFTVRL
jgi:hypothetical protein